jgi:tetratricopeptide (TPR) repeat protein
MMELIFSSLRKIMSRANWLVTAALVGTSVALVQPAVMAAKSAAQVQLISQAVTVEIRLQEDSSVGSGIIIAHQGDLYTIVTNRHVVCGRGSRNKVPEGETYALGLADGQKYQVRANSIRLIGTDLDLAIVQFRSSRKYPVAQIESSGVLKAADLVYTAGFPAEQPGFSFNQGKAIAVVDKRITGDRGGYSLIYDAATLPGMSGGGVFDEGGELVAIHGQGERYGENTELGDNKSRVGHKLGYNRGIPVKRLLEGLAAAGIKITENNSPTTLTSIRAQPAVSADEYFITGFNKLVEPGADVIAGKRAAIQELSKAIQINPRYSFAYFIRAYIYSQLQEFRQSLNDYNQVIKLNPNLAAAYRSRGVLKQDNLNDAQGALADYNQAIALSPGFALAYSDRGNLKQNSISDIQGALADYNQAIALNSRDGDFYYNRGVLKQEKLNDTQGAIADYDRAITLNPKDASAYTNRGILKQTKLNDIQGALADYNQSITLNPKLAETHNSLGILKHDHLRDSQGALTAYSQAIALNPQFAEAYYNRGNLKAGKFNDIRGALADYNQAIKINPQYINAYYNRGNLKKDKLNDHQGALADYNQVIRLNPEYARAYGNRGILKHEKLNDKAGAIQDFRQAAKLFRSQGQAQDLQKTLEFLQDLGAAE